MIFPIWEFSFLDKNCKCLIISEKNMQVTNWNNFVLSTENTLTKNL